MSRLFKKSLTPLVLLTMIFGCATPKKRTTLPATKKERAQLESAINSHKSGHSQQALKQLAPLLKKSDSELHEEALMLSGAIYLDRKDYGKASHAFLKARELAVDAPRVGEACYQSAFTFHEAGQFPESLNTLHQCLEMPDLPMTLAERLRKLEFILYSKTNEKVKALRALVILSNLPLLNKNDYRIKAIDLVQQLEPNELETVAYDSAFGVCQIYAKFKVGLLRYEAKSFSDAQSLLQDVANELPGTSEADQALSILEQIRSRYRVNPQVIGAVLPLTGRHSNIGIRTLRGLELGLGITGKSKSPLKLAVIDSEGDPEMAKQAVRRLVVEDNVIAIVGSVLSKTALAVASEAELLGIPSVGLSQRTGLTETGKHVFRNSLTSAFQIKELVNVAMKQLNFKRFAILYPNDSYGIECANLFWDEVVSQGGSIRAAQIYDTKETDFNGAVQRLVGTFYIEDRSDEYEKNLLSWKERQEKLKKKIVEIPPVEDLLAVAVDFDALFIPDTPKAIGQIAPMLAYNNIHNLPLLGTNLWNSPQFLQRGGRYVENSIFVDSFLPDDPSFSRSPFYGEFMEIYGEPPGIFEIQAFDSGQILRKILANGAQSRAEMQDGLLSLRTFPGALGPISMGDNREILRPLIPLTVTKGEIKKITEH